MSIRDLKDAIDVVSVVNMYPLGDIIDDDEELQLLCPWHSDASPSFFVNKRKKVFHCFGCNAKGSIIDFVMQMEGISFKQAVDKLSKMFNVDVTSDSTLRMGEEETIRWLIESRKKAPISTNGDESFIKIAKSASNKIKGTDFWKARRFPSSVIDFFELGCYNDRLIIPIRDVDGRLLGHSSRALIDKAGDDRFLHQKGFPKGGYLYNFNNVGKLLVDGQCDMIMIVEGFSDVWRAFAHGFLKCVAVMGSNVSDAQIDILLKHTYRVVLAFDNDDTGAGRNGMEEFWRKMKNLIEMEWMRIPKGKDIGNLGKDDFWTLYNKRIKI